MKKKHAFTLAETLLAMIIGGVLCSLMIKAISNTIPDKEQIQFLKAFHSLEAATANIANDGTRYDQKHGANVNALLNQTPLDTAVVTVDGVRYNKDNLTASNAYCLFVAEQLNTVGDVNCNANNNGLNFRTTSSGTFYGLSGDFSNNNGDISKDVTVSVSGSNERYVIRVLPDGRLTIPESTSASGVTQKSLCKERHWYENQSSTKKTTKSICG